MPESNHNRALQQVCASGRAQLIHGDLEALLLQINHQSDEAGPNQPDVEQVLSQALRFLIAGSHEDYADWTEKDTALFDAIAKFMPKLVAKMLKRNESQCAVLDHAFLALNLPFLSWFDEKYFDKNPESAKIAIQNYYAQWEPVNVPVNHHGDALKVIALKTPIYWCSAGWGMRLLVLWTRGGATACLFWKNGRLRRLNRYSTLNCRRLL